VRTPPPLRLVALDQIDLNRKPQFGGKAEGLARLLAHGGAVPSGFAVEATTQSPSEWSRQETQEFCARVRAQLDLGAPVAVRSSALGEDGASHSFAGLFESVLGVESEEAALVAAAQCIGSGAAERVRAYSGRDDAIPVGLVVQSQVRARAAGVCFTRDPNGKDAAVVIEAVSGTGDALVSGHVQPERWRVYRSGLGAWEAQLESAVSEGPVLCGADAIRIARKASELAERRNEPLDLEWALDPAHGLWWVQARPITAAAELPPALFVQRGCAENADDGPVTVWSNLNLRETMPDPLHPLSWSMWRDHTIPALATMNVDGSNRTLFEHVQPIDLVQGRIYWNMNGMMALPGMRHALWYAMPEIDAAGVEALLELRDRGILTPRRLPVGPLGVLAGMWHAQRRGSRALRAAWSPERTLEDLRAFGAEMIERRAAPLAERTPQELVEEIHAVTQPEFMQLHRMFTALFLAVAFYAVARQLFRRHPEAQRRLAEGIRNNPTTQMSVGIERLIEQARPCAGLFLTHDSDEELFRRLSESAKGRDWLDSLSEFLDWNGQRCPKEFDLSVPRWIEEPAMIVELVRSGLREPFKEGVLERLERLEGQRREAVAVAVAVAPFWKRPLLRWIARRCERHLPLREAGKHYLLMVHARVRELVLELGSRFAAEGVLADRDEIFFFELGEVESLVAGEGGDPRTLVEERRARLTEFAAKPAADCLRSDGVPVANPCAADSVREDGVICGAGVSTGRAVGCVRVLHSPDASAMRDGEVLVVRLADPGWTPLFPRAGAMVMEVGGVMCHAAVVARELGIPAVFGVGGATELLRDGEEVEVDADAGTIRRLGPAMESEPSDSTA